MNCQDKLPQVPEVTSDEVLVKLFFKGKSAKTSYTKKFYNKNFEMLWNRMFRNSPSLMRQVLASEMIRRMFQEEKTRDL